jgi:hypothetical protein
MVTERGPWSLFPPCSDVISKKGAGVPSQQARIDSHCLVKWVVKKNIYNYGLSIILVKERGDPGYSPAILVYIEPRSSTLDSCTQKIHSWYNTGI